MSKSVKNCIKQVGYATALSESSQRFSDDARYEISQLKELLKTLFPWKKASVRHPWVRSMAEYFL